MRDKRKNEAYYNVYIDYQEKRIRKKSDKLAVSVGDSAKVQRISRSLLNYQLDMVCAQFSAGADKNKLSKYLEEAIKTASQVDNLEYETLLNLLSLSVMMEIKAGCLEFITKHVDVIQNDKLLNCFAKYIQNNEVCWNGKFVIKGLYSSLDDLGNKIDKQSVLNNYLLVWYDAHKDFAWYDSHMNDKDTYVGYWSFEGAALAKIMKIDETQLANNEYYPLL